MTDLQIEALKTKTDNRRSLMEVMEFLTQRGANADTIRLAMIRAGITEEVARVLAQCIHAPDSVAPQAVVPKAVTPRTQTTQPELVQASVALPNASIHSASSRAAERALGKLISFVFLVAAIWGVGIVLGFTVGMELGVAQGVERGIEEGFARVLRFAGL